MDTADFAAGSKKAKAEIAAMHAAMERFSQAQTGLKEINAEIQKLQKHLALAQHLFGRSDQSKQIAAQIAGLKLQRAELYEILKLEKLRQNEQRAWVARQQSSLSGAIAAAAAKEQSSPAIAAEPGMFQGVGAASVFTDIKKLSTLVKGGGALLGITQLTNSIRMMRREMDEFQSSTLKADAVLRKLPGVGLIMEGAYAITGEDPQEDYRQAQVAFAKKQEYIMRQIQTRDDMEQRVQDIRDEMRIREMSGIEKEIALVKQETEARIEAIRVNQYALQWQKEIAAEAERANEASRIAELNRLRQEAEIEADKDLLRANVKRIREEEEAMESAVDAYESFLETLEKINKEWENSDFGRSDITKAIKPEKNPFTNDMEAAKLYESTRTASERLQDDIERWMDLYNSGELSGEVLSRAISGRLTLPRQATLPDLAVRGSQQAESLISRQMVGKTEKTQEEMLKEIMKIVRESKSSADLLRQIEKKLGGVNI